MLVVGDVSLVGLQSLNPDSPSYLALMLVTPHSRQVPEYTAPRRVCEPPFSPDSQARQLGKMQPVRSKLTYWAPRDASCLNDFDRDSYLLCLFVHKSLDPFGKLLVLAGKNPTELKGLYQACWEISLFSLLSSSFQSLGR